MTDRPMIFSAPMVRALLAGTKTQTRRMITPKTSWFDGRAWPRELHGTSQWDRAHVDAGPSPAGNPGPYLHLPIVSHDDETTHRIYPRVTPGDRLWARESFCYSEIEGGVLYRADGRAETKGWKPSIHMPRSVSRLTLTVTAVKIERLLDISEEDASAEGFEPGTLNDGFSPRDIGGGYTIRSSGTLCSAAGMFQVTWQKLHPEWDGFSSPWVVAITFTVEKGNIDA